MDRKKETYYTLQENGTYTFSKDWLKKVEAISNTKKVKIKSSKSPSEPLPAISQKAKDLLNLIASPTKKARNPQAYIDLCKYINELEEGF